MSAAVDHLLEFVFSVGGLTMASVVAIVGCWRWPARRRLCVLVISPMLVVVAASVPAVPRGLIRIYASYPPFERADLPEAKVVVLLGAGSTAIPGRAVQLDILEPVGAGRVLEAARVYSLLDRPLVISSGGATEGQAPSSRVMRDALVSLGVPADRIREEDRSQTTADEAMLIAPWLRALGVRDLVLVTSASHMPRAAAVFRAEGFAVVPAAASDYPKRRQHLLEARVWPSNEGWHLTRSIAHEWVGLLYYSLQGWTRLRST
jgi:uncharacterized SAM-binding protein YcdF (DUF218 family)